MSLSFVRRTGASLILLAMLLVSVVGVSAQDADLEPLTSALERSAAASNFGFDFNLTLNASGVAESDVQANISGLGSVAGEAADVSLDGFVNTGDQGDTFIVFLRLVDNALYFTEDGRIWTGLDLNEVGPSLSELAISNYRSGFGGDSSAADDPAVQEAANALVSDLMALDLTQFATTELVDEDTGLPVAHYVSQIDIPALINSDELMDILLSLVAVGDPEMAANATAVEFAMARSGLQDIFGQTSVQIDYYVNTETDYIQRLIVDVQMLVDPEAIGPGAGGTPVNIAANFDVELSNFETTAPIVAPEGAVMLSNVGTVFGLDLPDQPVATVVAPVTPTPTPAAAAVSTGGLTAGVPTTVTLAANGPADLTYTGTAGETVTITARSLEAAGTVDTTLEVLSPSGTRLAFNDDHSSDLATLSTFDSAVRDLTLPDAGDYTIRVSSFSGAAQGNVEVTVQSGSGTFVQPTLVPTSAPAVVTATPVAVVSSDVLTANVPATVALNASGPTDLTYTASAAETVTVIARSLEAAGTVDTTLEVLSPSGTRLAFNDDHSSDLPNMASFDSAVRDLSLPEAGDYTIRVSSFSGAAQGNVEVTVLTDGALPPATEVGPAVTATPVDVLLTGETDTVRGEVPAGSSFTFSFNGRPNQVTTITVIAGPTGDLDPKVTLIGPDGDVLAENDDHLDSDPALSSLDSRISDFVLPDEGEYSVVVTGFANSSGAFELTVRRAVPGGESIVTPVGPVSTPSVSSDEQVIAGQVRTNETYTHTLQANAGDVYTITVRGQNDFDPTLIISDPEGFVVAENDDHDSLDTTLDVFDSQVENLIIQEGGTYTIEVSDYSGDPGSFDLSILLVSTGAPLGPGEENVSLGQIEAGETFTTTVDLTAGDFFGVSIRTVSGDLDPVVSLISPSGQLVAENDDHGSYDSTLGRYDSQIPRALVSETGTYTIEVTGYSGSGTFTVTTNVLSR